MMTKEAFTAFCKGRHLTLADMRWFFGITDEKLINAYQSGALPVSAAVSEKVEEIIFSDVVELSASSREEKLDQLLSVLNQLPHKGAAVHNKIQITILESQEVKVDLEYLGYNLAF
ncbi:hypothetical protein [Adhaeribacter rhizoryzae]|uniref:Uncharacterized protein n=1 Tax=Adhaeribacter rhizoryzae TaxID=2607907 RepID=A0A5M6DPA6_9BACT|nr:hypothetical protein [Adhaeribacter rhizoryzae]KAA5548099.1 hypothetical protein F0145_05065 [Adhaeribacter rhizoryzae]